MLKEIDRSLKLMASGTYGCAKCEERKRTGKPAALLPSGLLGPVTLQPAEVRVLKISETGR